MITSNKILVLYLRSIVDSVFKILPLYEEKNEGLILYVESLLSELYGAQTSIQMRDVPDYVSLLSTLEAVKADVAVGDNKPLVKRNVFKAINLIKNIISKIDGESSV